MWSKGNPLHCWWECKLMQTLWKTVWRFLKKLKIELPHDPSIPLLGIYPKTTKTLIWKDTCIPMFIAALFIITKIWKQPKCTPTEEWLKKRCHIHTHTHTYIFYGILLSHQKEWNFAICNNIDGLGRYYAKWNKSDKDKYCMISLICRIYNSQI